MTKYYMSVWLVISFCVGGGEDLIGFTVSWIAVSFFSTVLWHICNIRLFIPTMWRPDGYSRNIEFQCPDFYFHWLFHQIHRHGWFIRKGLFFKKIIVRYKKIGYNINVMRHTAYLVVHPIKVISFAYMYRFYCTTVGRTSDWMTVPS